MRGLLQAITLVMWAGAASAQVATDSKLYRDLEQHDRMFFERAFNGCDLAYLERAIHPDLRFYHDQGGFQDREAFLQATRRNICGDPEHKPIRKLDTDSLEVFPLYADGTLYGAIQRGTHRFYLRNPDGTEVPTSRARFTHVYLLDDGRWLLTEVLSYDHGDPRPLSAPAKP